MYSKFQEGDTDSACSALQNDKKLLLNWKICGIAPVLNFFSLQGRYIGLYYSKIDTYRPCVKIILQKLT